MQSLTHAQRILDELNKQRETGEFTDVTVIVEGRKFDAHRSILVTSSSVFRSVLQDTLSDGTPNINLDGFDSNNFSIVLDFLYTSTLKVDGGNVAQVQATAEFLKVSSVVDLCVKYKQQHRKEEASGNNRKLKISHNFEERQSIEIEVVEDNDKVGRNLPSSYNGQPSGQRRGRKSLERYECPYCKKQMTQVRLETHIRTHTGEKPVTCARCGGAFANVYNLRIHERTHTGEKPFKCVKCGKQFSDPSSLGKHKLWHAGVKNKSCPICRRMFTTPAQVRDHIRTHTKEKPFSCKQCGKRYGYKCDLTRHMREHSGNLFGPCPDCGRLFNHNGNYKVHLKTHQKKEKQDSHLGVFFVEDGNNEMIAASQDKVDDLAELVSQGHNIEVVIDDGKLLVKKSNFSDQLDNGSCVMSQEEEVMSATTSLEQNMLSHDDVVKNENSLVIVDQTMEIKFETIL
uniref:Zinc finger protein n=1 Tax=Ciona savignyi TaxID=51511 RepID=H2Y664_CIOSA